MVPGGDSERRLSRRSVLQSTLGAGATAFTLSGCIAVDEPDGADGPLAYTPGYFIVYASARRADPADPRSFGYPDAPGFAGYSDKDYLGRSSCVLDIFDTRTVIRETGGEALRTELKFTPPAALVGRAKPYRLEHRGRGRYTAVTPIEFDPPRIPRRQLWSFLNGEDRWRAVVGDFVALDAAGGEFDWAVTRADFYRLPGTQPVYSRSLQYLFWANDPTRGNDFGTDPPFCSPWVEIPAIVATAASNLIAAGRLSTSSPLPVERLEPTPEPTRRGTDEPGRPERPERQDPPGAEIDGGGAEPVGRGADDGRDRAEGAGRADGDRPDEPGRSGDSGRSGDPRPDRGAHGDRDRSERGAGDRDPRPDDESRGNETTRDGGRSDEGEGSPGDRGGGSDGSRGRGRADGSDEPTDSGGGTATETPTKGQEGDAGDEE